MKFNFRKISLVLVLVTFSGYCTSSAFAGQTKNETLFDCDKPTDDPIECVACNIYWEARGEPIEGYWVPALATLNRVEGKLYPSKKLGPKVKKEKLVNEFCQVVYEERWDKKRGKWVAMFSWIRDGQHDRVTNKKGWVDSLELATKIVKFHTDESEEKIVDITFGCQWYHNDTVEPYWKDSYHPTVKIGAHQCYAASENAYHNALAEVVPGIGSWSEINVAGAESVISVPAKVILLADIKEDGDVQPK